MPGIAPIFKYWQVHDIHLGHGEEKYWSVYGHDREHEKMRKHAGAMKVARVNNKQIQTN